jgi:hypothetical protein
MTIDGSQIEAEARPATKLSGARPRGSERAEVHQTFTTMHYSEQKSLERAQSRRDLIESRIAGRRLARRGLDGEPVSPGSRRCILAVMVRSSDGPVVHDPNGQVLRPLRRNEYAARGSGPSRVIIAMGSRRLIRSRIA